MAYFDKYGVEFTDDRKKIIECPKNFHGEYIIPSGVTIIGECAFYNCKSLTSVTIPNSVASIEMSAFEECRNLTSVIIHDGVTHIGMCAFQFCFNLTSIKIPNSVTIIDNAAFRGCHNLTSVILPKDIQKIGNDAFVSCSSLNSIVVPLGQEEHFCAMDGLKDFAEIIRKTSEIQKAILRQREEEEQRRLQEQQRQEMLQGSILFFDTETTGKPIVYNAPVTDSDNWPRLVQLAWIMTDQEGKVLKKKSVIIRPDGFSIPIDAAAIHGITTEKAKREGLPLAEVLEEFGTDLSLAKHIVGHNIDFDRNIVSAEVWRICWDYSLLMNKPFTCTMKSSSDFCAIPNSNSYFGGYKWPSLQELYQKLFGRSFEDAHDALSDITATKDCYFELKRRGIIKE